MFIRLIACDLDGTLATRDGFIHPESIAALQQAREQGILVVLATGRLPLTLGHYLDQLGVTNEPIIAAQGALIAYRDGRVLRRLTLPAEVAREAARLAKPLGAGMAYFTENHILVDSYVFSPDQYTLWFGAWAELQPNALTQLNDRLIKFMAIHADETAVPRLLETLREGLRDRAHVTRSWHHFVEGAAPGADKGSALAWLCEQLNIRREEVLAIGDGGNDVTMLQWAGFSAAPADGDPSALAVAQWIAPPIDKRPLAKALAHFLHWES
ncbi:MAG: HAD family phosphatase [Chloroflexi bacterium]|nr:HAD family phosphatase [Chloroflexota bacterium]